MEDFEGKTVIVTGAGSGIGQTAALMYAQHGAKVAVSDLDENHGQDTVSQIRSAGGEATFVQADVSRAEDCERMVNETVKTYGRLDIAFNNAGIGGQLSPVGELTIESWDQVIAINLSGVFYCMKYQIPAMLKHNGGSIVNMSSILGQVGEPAAPAYVAAKHGVIGLTRSAALAYAQQNIRVNAICPAYINTPLINNIPPEMMKGLVTKHPVNRLGETWEVAELVLWLSSRKASFVTGSAYSVDGGYLAQ